MLDLVYWTGFKNKLETEMYNVATDKEVHPIKIINPEEVRLLKWDWLSNPSIVNKKIEERLTKDLQDFVNN